MYCLKVLKALQLGETTINSHYEKQKCNPATQEKSFAFMP